jgi:hypothetical protein
MARPTNSRSWLTRCGAFAAVLGVIIALVACDDDNESPDPADGSDTTTTVETSAPSLPLPTSTDIAVVSRRCQIAKGGGGFDVVVHDIDCQQAVELVGKLGVPSASGKAGTGKVVDRGNGWKCWAQLLGEAGPAQNVCWNGNSVIAYKFA